MFKRALSLTLALILTLALLGGFGTAVAAADGYYYDNLVTSGTADTVAGVQTVYTDTESLNVAGDLVVGDNLAYSTLITYLFNPANSYEVDRETIYDGVGALTTGELLPFALAGDISPVVNNTEGTYRFTLITAGNDGGWNEFLGVSIDVVYDTTAPTITIDAVNNKSTEITGTASDNLSPIASVEVFYGNSGGKIGDATVAADGSWSVPVTGGDLDISKETIVVFAYDAAGNMGFNGKAITMAVASTPITVSEPADGARVGNQSMLYYTALTNATVGYSINGTASTIQSFLWSDSYSFSMEFLPEFAAVAEGASFTLTLDYVDYASAPVTLTLTKDTTAPDAPVITSVPDNRVTEISGTGEIGAEVMLSYGNGDPIGYNQPVIVDASGEWTATLTGNLLRGKKVVAQQFDEADNTSPYSDTVTVLKADGAAIQVLTPAEFINITTNVVISGVASAGEKLTYSLSGGNIASPATGSIDVDGNGDWSRNFSRTFADGVYTIEVSYLNIQPNTVSYRFTVDTVKPDVPVITAPVYYSDTSISGTAEPFAEVLVTYGNVAFVIGTAVADANGEWTLDGVALDTTKNGVKARATDCAGNVGDFTAMSPLSYKVVGALAIDAPVDGGYWTRGDYVTVSGTGEPDALVFVRVKSTVVGLFISDTTTVVDGNGDWTVNVQLYGAMADGAFTVIADYVDFASDEQTVTVTLDTVAPEVVIATSPIYNKTGSISGTTEPNATVFLTYGNNDVIGNVTADGSGAWSFTFAGGAPEAGRNKLKAYAIDVAGNQGVTASADIVTLAPLVITAPVDGGYWTRRDYVTVSGTGEPGEQLVVEVSDSRGANYLVYPAVDGNGDWTVNVNALGVFGEGALTITADYLVLPSDEQTVTVTVDTVKPDAPVITAPIYHSDTSVSGTAEPYAKVFVVYGNQDAVGDTVADASGDWTLSGVTFDSTKAGLRAYAVDAAGHKGDLCTIVNFSTLAPIVITAPVAGSVTRVNDLLTVIGTAEPDAVLAIRFNGEYIDHIIVESDGSLTYTRTVTPPLFDGTHEIKVEYVDWADVSTTVSFTVDTAIPAVPTMDAITTRTATITGTGVDGTTIFLTTGSPQNANKTVAEGIPVVGGAWSYDYFADKGAYPTEGETIMAYAISASGVSSQENAGGSFKRYASQTVVAGVGEPITITAPVDGFVTAVNNALTVTGTAQMNEDVIVSVAAADGAVVASRIAAVDATGTFNAPLAFASVVDGVYTVMVSYTTLEPGTVTRDFTIDTAVPAAPTMDAITNRTMSITGMADPATVKYVSLYRGANKANVIALDIPVDPATGAWSYDYYTAENKYMNVGWNIFAYSTSYAGLESATGTKQQVTAFVGEPIVITEPVDGVSTTNNSSLFVFGSAQSGEKVTITVTNSSGVNAYPPQTVVAISGGVFNVGFSVAPATLADGVYTVTVDYVELASAPVSVSYTISTAAPAAPTMDAITNRTATITGMADPATVKYVSLYRGANKANVIALDIPVDPVTGAWSYDYYTAENKYMNVGWNIFAYSTSYAGLESATGTKQQVTAAVGEPIVIDRPVDGEATTNNQTLQVYGLAQDGEKIVITVTNSDGVNAYPPQTVVAIFGGVFDAVFSVAPATLPDGVYTVTVDYVELASAPVSVSYTIAVAAPAAPLMDAITNRTATITGSGVEGTTIRLTYGNGDIIANGIAVGSDGSWSYDFLAEKGAYPAVGRNILAYAESASDVLSTTFAKQTVVAAEAIDITLVAPVNGTSTQVKDGVDVSGFAAIGEYVVITLSASGTELDTVIVPTCTINGSFGYRFDYSANNLQERVYTVTVEYKELDGTGASATFEISTVAPDAPTMVALDNRMTEITGTAVGAATVTLTFGNGNVIASGITVESDGSWSYDWGGYLPYNRKIDAYAVSASGVSSVGYARRTVGMAAGVTIGITSPVNASFTQNNTTIAVNGIAAADELLNLVISGPNGELVNTQTLTTDAGEFSASFDYSANPLRDGVYTVSVSYVNLTGDVESVSYTISTVVPAAPTMVALDNRMTEISGTAVGAATVTLTFGNGNLIASGITVEADGSWSYDWGGYLPYNRKIDAFAVSASGVVSTDYTRRTVGMAAGVTIGIDEPLDGSFTADNAAITVSGTATADEELTIVVSGPDGEVLNTTTTSANDGSFSVSGDYTANVLEDGLYTVSVSYVNLTGDAAVVTFTIDTVVPGAPTMASLDNRMTEISGFADTAMRGVLLVSDSGLFSDIELVVDSTSGAWSYDFGGYLPVDEIFYAYSVSQSGVVSALFATANVGKATGNDIRIDIPTDGSSVNEITTIYVEGYADPNEWLVLTVTPLNTPVSQEVQADGSGFYSYTFAFPTDLDETEYTVTAEYRDINGNTAVATFTTDVTLPASPTVDAITHTETVLSGTAEVGATITISGGTIPAGTTAVADGDGVWSVTIPAQAVGTEITVVAADAAGNVSADAATVTVGRTEAPIAITAPPADSVYANNQTLVITGTGVAGQEITVTLDKVGEVTGLINTTVTVAGDGTWTATFDIGSIATFNDEYAVATVVYTALPDDSHFDGSATQNFYITGDQAPENAPMMNLIYNDELVISGFGEIGASVALSVNGMTLGTAVVDGNGEWSLALANTLVAGAVVTATQTYAGGTLASPEVTRVVLDRAVPVDTGAPTIDTVLVGDTTISGTGFPTAVVTVTLEDGTVLTASVGLDDSWSVTVTGDLVAGELVTATQAFDGGADSDEASVMIMDATTQLAAPTMGAVNTDTTKLSGTGVAGAIVTVSGGTLVDATAIVGADGKWTMTIARQAKGVVLSATQRMEYQLLDSPAVTVTVSQAQQIVNVNPNPTTYYTVEFESNGGSEVADQSIASGGKATEPVAPTRDDYTFIGWFVDEELTEKYDFNTAVTKNITLYAGWADEWVCPFIDVKKTSWYYDAVCFVARRGITTGATAVLYAPNRDVTRAEFITMVLRAYGIDPVDTGVNFDDAGEGKWYTGYLAAAKQLGISDGVGNNLFAPDRKITRQEMVVMLYNCLKVLGLLDDVKGSLTYDDSDDVSSWAVDAVAYASAHGWVEGVGNNLFNPKGLATRAELAQMLYNLLKDEV